MLSSILLLLAAVGAPVVAQSSPSVVCVAGQCVQGFTNITIGATLTAPGVPSSVLLLPGQYDATTNPQLLHTLLTNPSTKLTPSVGFDNNASLSSLPLNLALAPGLAIYSQSHYSGQPGFSPLPTTPIVNSSIPLTANSLIVSSNLWIEVSSGSNDRIIIWDAVPDLAQLPAGISKSLTLLDMQSSACSPACAGSATCSASGQCVCPTGFTGSSCETCAPGFFGPTCQACPKDCSSCDEGISGSGRCLTPIITDAPSTCNCLNGKCGANGQCDCNAGWTAGDNGTACSKCATGFFLTSTGDCSVCQLGCTQCADQTGACISCKSGFTQDANDRTKCSPVPTVTSAGKSCPPGSFSDGTNCNPCSPSCRTCTGGTSNDCIVCASGQYLFNGNCVGADSDGVCQGAPGMVADNNKNECDACGAKCTSCKIPNFNAGSTVDDAQCTGCLPGFFLSQGKCVQACPSGTFVSPQDNLSCIPCDSSCSTCSGSSTFCLTCASNQLAANGKCVSSCPSNTFSSSGSCLTCHPDCASCSGPSFNQCSSCPEDRPVLSNGRCLPVCSKSQYFDKASSTCLSCDSSCSSCSGPGPSNCLACSSSTQVLQAGSCVSANCNGSNNVIPGLGLCLSELVQVPQPSGTNSVPPLPSITGLGEPTTPAPVVVVRKPLAWWQILLMALGCAFIFVVIIMVWRRRARKQRAKRTAQFASAKKLDRSGWRWRLLRFGEKLFGHSASPKGGIVHTHMMGLDREEPNRDIHEREDIKLANLRDVEEARHSRNSLDLENFIDSYDYSRKSMSSRRAPSTMPSRISRSSIYSEVTGVPHRTPVPRQPIRKELLTSRFSVSTVSTARTREELPLIDLQEIPPVPRLPTEAERYVMAVKPTLVSPPYVTTTPQIATQGNYWMQPINSGSSTASRNPFRQ